MAYLPGNMTRVKVKVVGDLNIDSVGDEGVLWKTTEADDITERVHPENPASRKKQGD